MTVETGQVELTFNERMMIAVRRMGGRTAAASYFGIAPLTISRWTTGQSVPALTTIRAVATASGVPYEWLRPAQDDPEPASVVHPLGLEPRTHWFSAWDVVAAAESVLREAEAVA